MRIYINKREAYVLSTALVSLAAHCHGTMIGFEAQDLLDKLNLTVNLQKSGNGCKLAKLINGK